MIFGNILTESGKTVFFLFWFEILMLWLIRRCGNVLRFSPEFLLLSQEVKIT